MSATSRSSLVNFFVYNTEYGQKEGSEGEKVMLYIPQEESEDWKIKRIGLCEALVQFSKTFHPDRPCECLTTQKTKQFFMNPEGNFWMVLTLSVPSVEKMMKDKKAFEYLHDDIQEPVVRAILKQAYSMFVLFNGPFAVIREKYSLTVFKQRLEFFYTRYLQTLNFGQLDLVDVYQGISYLPIDKSSFLRVQCFSNLIDTTFKCVQQCCFLYNEQLVWTTLEHDDMQILYKYLTTSLLPSSHEAELSEKDSANPSIRKTASSSSLNSVPQGISNAGFSNPGKFLTAPAEMTTSPYQMPKRSPHVFVNVEGNAIELHLIVYKAFNAIVCLMIDLQALSVDLCQKLHNFVGPQLGNLSNVLTEQIVRLIPASSDQQYRFIYFNDMNLAIKSSIHAKRSNQVSVSSDIMKLLVDIHGDFEYQKQDGETVVKTLADCWIVGKRWRYIKQMLNNRQILLPNMGTGPQVPHVMMEVSDLSAAMEKNLELQLDEVMGETGVTGVLCTDVHGLPLAAKGIAANSPAGSVAAIAMEAGKLFPDSNDHPVVTLEGEGSNLLIRRHEKIVLGVYKGKV